MQNIYIHAGLNKNLEIHVAHAMIKPPKFECLATPKLVDILLYLEAIFFVQAYEVYQITNFFAIFVLQRASRSMKCPLFSNKCSVLFVKSLLLFMKAKRLSTLRPDENIARKTGKYLKLKY